ncbi:Riboflavin biosynthesis protein RibD [Gracilaria domingensis]|nr:Riboflavin biosynthesis protein RibD [Gracilaria domingensis]
MGAAPPAFLPPLPLLRPAARSPARSPSLPARHPPRPRVAATAAAVPNAATDAQHMRRAVDLARLAEGQTRPNPPVGCVITSASGERVLGEGYHQRAGYAHAEVNALQDARRKGNDVAGATAYVSLEPCNHYGRTPPCSVALVKARVARVVVGMIDPDPRTAGNGVQTLRSAGISVSVGVEGQLCQRLNDGFVHRVVKRRPFGILKYAMTLDGKIAASDGSSKWVTGSDARQRVQQIRRSVDAIIVGGQTVRKDDPRLTVRDGRCLDAYGLEQLSPIRVVMTRDLQLPADARLWNDLQRTPTIVLADASHGRPAFASELIARGVQLEQVPGLSPDDAMAYLYEQSCLSVLWECGGNLAGQAVRDGAVQKVYAFIAPKIVGGSHSPTPLANPPVAQAMNKAISLEHTAFDVYENGDVLLSGYLKK